jgi:hypothetical protein
MGAACGVAVGVDVGRVDRHPLTVEPTLGPGTRGVLLAAQTEAVGVFAGDSPLVGDALGPFELRGHLVAVEVGLRDRHAEAELLRRVDADRDAAHDLDAAGDGGVDDAGPDEGSGEVGGLLAAAALGVDGGGRRGERQACGQPRSAGDVEALLADLADAAAHDLSDLSRIDAGAIDQRLLHDAEQLGRVHRRQAAVAAADGCAHGVDDDHRA